MPASKEHPGRELAIVTSSQLAGVSHDAAVRLGSRPGLPNETYEPTRRIPQVAFERTQSLTRQEIRSERLWVAAPSWIEGSVPSLIITQRLHVIDGHSVAMSIQSLDSAFRRAYVAADLARQGEHLKGWPTPVRPERGGLYLVSSNSGSLEWVWTFYGALVSFAASTPVSLASFASLAVDTFALTKWMRQKWIVRPVTKSLPPEPPRADEYEGDKRIGLWSPEDTKAVIGQLGELAKSGIGVEFHQVTPVQETRIVLYPIQGD